MRAKSVALMKLADEWPSALREPRLISLIYPLHSRGAQRGVGCVPKTFFPQVARNFQGLYLPLLPPIGFS